MNKRIEKLSIEANSQTGNEFDLNHKPLDAFLAKFAELIVRECADICYNRDYTDGSRYGDEICEHFGVE
jgi:hypothetical protein